MNLATIACSSCDILPGVTMDTTFGEQTHVYRIGGKMFALVNVDPGNLLTVKVRPEDGEALRATHYYIQPGYYMNKQHWISIDLQADIPTKELRAQITELITDSYQLVLSKLPRSVRSEISP